MAYSYTPTYVTYADFKDQTIVTDLASITDANFQKLVARAEILVDNYVGVQTKYDEDQTRQFPRSLDIDTSGDTFIPSEVEMATCRIVESLYKEGETKSASANAMTSEKIGDYSYQRGKSSAEMGGLDMIPPEAQQLLSRFRRRAVQLSPSTGADDTIRPLNSRQKFLKTQR